MGPLRNEPEPVTVPDLSRAPTQSGKREAAAGSEEIEAGLPGGVLRDRGRDLGVLRAAFGVDDLEVRGRACPVRDPGELEGLSRQPRGVAGGDEGLVGAAHRLERDPHLRARLPERSPPSNSGIWRTSCACQPVFGTVNVGGSW